jgi:large subunit ribosomal protein L1
VSFEVDQLSSNLAALASELLRAKPASSRGRYLRHMSVSSTMGPGVKVDVGALEDFAKKAS